MSYSAPVLRAPTPDNTASVSYGQTMGYENPPPSPASNPSTFTPYQQDSLAYLKSVLDYYDLGSLSQWAWNQLVAGNSPDQIMQELRQTPEFKRRFPAIEQRRAAGLSPMSVDEILAYEKQARWVMHSAGLPLGFYDSRESLQSFIAKDVSLSELSQRIQLAAQDYFSTDTTLRDELGRIYGLTPGQHLAYILDSKTALPLIQRQWLSASLSAAAVNTGYGGLTQSEAESLSGIGVTREQAAQGFNTLQSQRGLFTPLPGESAPTIAREDQFAAAFFDDADAQLRIRRRQRERVGVFQAGGQFASSQTGISGIGAIER